MLYKLNLIKFREKSIEQNFHKSMKELRKFYGINWIKNTPKIILVKDRKSINLLRAQETEPWLVGWANDKARIVFVLDRNNFEQESSHKYSKERYSALIKHELSHLFYYILSGSTYFPKWLVEGVAIYTSGQNKLKQKPDKLKNFLEFYKKSGSEVYAESGFVVETLVKNFGKNKLLKLIKSLRNVSNEKQFNKIFQKIYGFKMNYQNINMRYLSL